MDTLKRGSKARDVARIQRRLAQRYPGTAVVADGDFGEKTEAAVRKFQADAGLPVDGIVDRRTHGALAALRLGDTGREVARLQAALKGKRQALEENLSALEASLNALKSPPADERKALQEKREKLKEWPVEPGADKTFDTATQKAVSEFQEHEGLSVTGFADSRTRAALGFTVTDVEEWQDVFAEELRIIGKRRDPAHPVKDDLVGLAFSGGGIRSATFGLGVLDGMKALGLLGTVDYLSTVSGGGYIGAWLSANCKRAGKAWLSKGADWTRSIGHLRRYSNYLSPEVGFFSADTWSMAAVWMRNTMLVQVTIVLAIAFALLLPRPLLEVFKEWPGVGDWRWLTVVVFIVAVAGIAGNQLRLGTSEHYPLLQAKYWPRGLILGLACVALAFAVGDHWDFHPFTNEVVNHGVAFFVAILAVAAGFFFLTPGVQLVKTLWRGKDGPERVDYTQFWVQHLVVFPLLITGYLVAAVMWGQIVDRDSPFKGVETYGGFLAKEVDYWPFPLQIALASLWLLSICSVPFREGSLKRKARALFIALIAPAPALLVLYLLVCAIMVLLRGWAGDADRGPWLAFVWAPSLVLWAFSLSIVALIGAMGRQSTESAREWWSRLGAWLAIYGFTWMLVTVAAAYGPLWAAAMLDGEFWTSLAAVGGWIVTTVGGLLAGKSSSTGDAAGEAKKSGGDKIKELIALVAPFVFIAGLLIGVSTCVHLVILNLSAYGDLWSFQDQDLYDWHWVYMSAQPLGVVGLAIVVVAFATWFMSWRVDINEFSLNAFYRNRLGRCYLGATRAPGERKPQNFTGFDEGDDLALSELLRKSEPVGPFHIVNCALNLGGSSDLELHTRHSASFTLTPLAVGTNYGPRDPSGLRDPIGYKWTSAYGGRNNQPTLAQAVSVSGAAASPNMGYHTSPVVAFLLTMFNARLGWWFPNPREGGNSPSPRSSLKYLLFELFGVADDRSNFLMISDGGHFENLAAYELIKRRCRVVIVSDGECDPRFKFEGLGTLIRMCEVDFGYKIDIKVGSIPPTAGSQWSASRCAIGRIEYDPGDRSKDGFLIYLKASMSGHESTAILQYKSGHPAFPHESTGDQFYGEDQFESYRNLGREIAKQTFEPMAGAADWESGARKLLDYFAPALKDTRQFTRHSDHLMQLWTRLGSDPKVDVFDAAFEGRVDTESSRSVYFTCSRMLQLMENVYLDLDLENTWEHPDNAGWRATFERWAESPAIQKAWELSGATYGKRFQYFCERRLKFKLP